MKIGIDCRLSGSKNAGIGRYTSKLVQHLLNQYSKIDWVLFFYSEEQKAEVIKNINLKNNHKTVITPIRHYTLQEQIKLHKIFAKENLDLLHVPHFNVPVFYNKPFVVTIHDLLWHQYKGLNVTTLNPVLYILKYVFYRIVTYFAINKAKAIIVPAQTIKETILNYYPRVGKKIFVTKEGAELDESKPLKLTKLDKTLLYVGSLYPHKNIKVVLRALKKLPDYKLLIAGSRSVFQEQVFEYIKNNNLDHQVEFLGYVKDKDLQELYAKVTALVQPSLSEGFGLTGVEAMAMGTPVLASDIPIFKEIYQDAVYYFSPHSETSFISALHTLESGGDLEEKAKLAKKLIKQYSWPEVAKLTYEVYTKI